MVRHWFGHLALWLCGLAFTTAANAVELPARKPGLWDLKMTFEGRNLPPQNMQHCVDAATDKLMNANFGGMARQACSKQDMKTVGDVITIDSVCKYSNVETTSHAVITGRFDQAYTVKVTSTRTGGPTPASASPETHLTIEAKWLGSCKPGQKPGDIIMGNGMKMNVLEMRTPAQPPQH